MSAATTTRRAPSVDTLVLAERIYTVLRFDFTGPVAAVIGAAVIAAFAWDKPGAAWAAGWLISVLAVVALWIALLVAFRRTEPDAEDIRSWHRRALLCAVASGTVWGS